MDNDQMSIEEIERSKCDNFWIRHLLADPETWPESKWARAAVETEGDQE